MATFAIQGHVPCNLCGLNETYFTVCLFVLLLFFVGLIKTDMISRTGNVNVRMPEMHKNCTQNNIVNVCTERFTYNRVCMEEIEAMFTLYLKYYHAVRSYACENIARVF